MRKQITDTMSRPSDLKMENLGMTSEQSELLRALMVDTKSTKDPTEAFLIMKYWFLRSWEAAEKQGDDERRILNQWRSKKAEILTKQAKTSCERGPEKSVSSTACHCPHCKVLICPVWDHNGEYYECSKCHLAFKEEDYKINWITTEEDIKPKRYFLNQYREDKYRIETPHGTYYIHQDYKNYCWVITLPDRSITDTSTLECALSDVQYDLEENFNDKTPIIYSEKDEEEYQPNAGQGGFE